LITTMTHATLNSILRELRRRLLAVEVGAGLVWASIAAVASLVIWMWLDLVLELTPALRIGSWAGAVILAAVVTAKALRSGRRQCEARSLARRLDQATGAAGQILTGVELMTQLQLGGGILGGDQPALLTAGLAEMAVDRASQLAGSAVTGQAAPSRPLHRPAGALVLIAAGLGVICLLSPRLARTQWLRFIDPGGDHPPYSRIWFEVKPGTTRVVYGQGLDITVRPCGGVPERVDLVLLEPEPSATETLPMFPESGGSWRATIANLTAPHQYYVRADRARSHKFNITIQTVPRLEAVRFKITPPAYSRRAAYEGPLPQGGLAGLPRTHVQVWARSNRPLSGGRLEVIAQSNLPASAPADITLTTSTSPADRTAAASAPLAATADPNEVSGSFVLQSAGRLVIRVVDVDGQPSPDSFTATITLTPDERPFIRLLAPPTESLATPSAVIPVSMAAEDDCGISRVQLFRSLNDSRPLPMDVSIPGPAPTRWSDIVELPLGAYRLQPSDEIKLFARVEDNDPDGPKGAESTVATVRIISEEDYERLMRIRAGLEVLMAKYQQAQRRVESLLAEIEKLRTELNALPRDSQLSQAHRQGIEALSRELSEAVAAIQAAADKHLPYDLDRNLEPRLRELARKLAEANRQIKPLTTQPGVNVAAALDRLEKMSGLCGAGRKEFDRDVKLPLEHLAAIYPLMEDQARFIALYERQRDLATRLSAMKDQDRLSDPSLKARMRDLETEQQQVREALDELLSDIEDHVAKLPADARLDKLRETASKFAQAVRESRALPAMSDALTGLADFSGTRGYQGAAEAADVLEKFISRCHSVGNQGQMCLKFQPTLAAGLGNTIEQLLADAGLSTGTGSGMGTGTGGGYSARQSTLQNIGLYGGPTALGGLAEGSSLHGTAAHAGKGARETEEHRNEPPTAQSAAGLRSIGGNQAEVPVQYRRKVGQYFERIADEMPDQHTTKRNEPYRRRNE
jgi:Skp family chaperone for outer membrane proteins